MKNNRKQQRTVIAVCLILVGAVLGVMGFDGWYVNHTPASIVGLVLAIAGILGLCGVNVWWGGALDPRNGNPQPPSQPSSRQTPLDEPLPPDFR